MVHGHFFKWRRFNKETEKEEITLVQGGLRPSVLGTWEYIFPEEALPAVLNLFGLVHKDGKQRIHIGETKINKIRLAMLRKICGCKAIPKQALIEASKLPQSIMLTDSERGLSHMGLVPGVSRHPIGIKKDARGDFYDPEAKCTRFQELL